MRGWCSFTIDGVKISKDMKWREVSWYCKPQ